MTEPFIRKRARSNPAADVVEPDPQQADPDAEEATSSTELAPTASYIVGRGKPPVETRYGQPGGNQPGRKRKSKSRQTVIEEECNAMVQVAGQGRLPKYRVAIRQLVNKAAGGDIKSILACDRLLLEHERFRAAAGAVAEDAPLTSHEQSVLEIFMDMAREELEAKQQESGSVDEDHLS